jgi:hypothetical protein
MLVMIFASLIANSCNWQTKNGDGFPAFPLRRTFLLVYWRARAVCARQADIKRFAVCNIDLLLPYNFHALVFSFLLCVRPLVRTTYVWRSSARYLQTTCSVLLDFASFLAAQPAHLPLAQNSYKHERSKTDVTSIHANFSFLLLLLPCSLRASPAMTCGPLPVLWLRYFSLFSLKFLRFHRFFQFFPQIFWSLDFTDFLPPLLPLLARE